MKRKFKPKKYISRQLYSSPLFKSAKNMKEYEKWNKVLEKEGMAVINDDNRGTKEFSSKSKTIELDGMKDNLNLEYYSVFKAYCEYYKYDIKTALKIKEVLAGRKRNTRAAFKKMLRMFVNGLPMANAYNAVSAEYNHNINTSIFFYKRFKEAKSEFLAAYPKFSDYLEYVKYELGEPLPFEIWCGLQ